MADTDFTDPERREGLNRCPVVAPDMPEERHFYTCAKCRQRVDKRRLGDVLHHEEPGHQPTP